MKSIALYAYMFGTLRVKAMTIQYIVYTGTVRTGCQSKMTRGLAPYNTVPYNTESYFYMCVILNVIVREHIVKHRYYREV